MHQISKRSVIFYSNREVAELSFGRHTNPPMISKQRQMFALYVPRMGPNEEIPVGSSSRNGRDRKDG